MSTEQIPKVIKGRLENSYFLFISKPPKTTDYKGKAKIAWLNHDIREIEMKNLNYVGMDQASECRTPDYRYHTRSLTILEQDRTASFKDQAKK